MKILIRQFLGNLHSWSIFGWGMASNLIAQGHQVDLFSTNGIQNFPNKLKPNLIGYFEENKNNKVFGRLPDPQYDCQISYTCMKNFPHLLSNGSKNRLGIWCYEWAGKNSLPTGFAKHYKSCDVICAPSNFAKRVFIESGIPDNHIKVIPHGIDSETYNRSSTIKLPTNKKYKILANIAQNHLRKNIPDLLEAYGRAFTNKDDVCLILKAKMKPVKMAFDISLQHCLNDFYQKYSKHAEVKIIPDFIEDLSDLYRSVDTVFSMSHCEGFYFPGLEAIASGKLVIAPNWGGQLDFLNQDNSLLISGQEVRANPRSMYWESKNNAIWFQPSINDAVDKLQYGFKHYLELNKKISDKASYVISLYDWQNISKQFAELCL